MEQKTILVPLDGSTASEAAIPYAEAIAKAQHAALRLLRIVPTEYDFLFLKSAEWDAELLARLRDEALDYVQQRAATLRDQGIETSTAVAAGNVTEEILRDAGDADAAMIVMATHGRGGVQRWVLGSVADKVMRMGRIPTLLLQSPEAPIPAHPVALRTLLLPLDGSPVAEAALEPAVTLAQVTGAKLLLLRVEPWVSSTMALAGDGMYVPDLGQIEEQAEASARDYIASICTKIPSTVAYQAFVVRGIPTAALEQFVEDEHIDLVVMSTHGRGGLTRFAVGSTADRLVRTGVPTLLIRPADLPERMENQEVQTAGSR